MEVIQNLVSQDKYNIKCPYTMSPTRIVVHNTANDASARNEIAYMIKNSNTVSFHFAIDDKEIIQGIPLDRNAWNAGDGNGKGNREGIAIEICYSKSGGERFINAERNVAKFIAQLLKERNWGIDRVTKHQDYSGKYCPHRTLDMGWQRFLNMISEYMETKDIPKVNTYTGNSIVDYLTSIGQNSSFQHRAILAKQNGITNYSGTANQNLALLQRLKSGADTSDSPQTDNPIVLEAKQQGMKVATTLPAGSHFWISEHASVYGGASYGVKIPEIIKQATTRYTSGGQRNEHGCSWVLAKEIMSWVKVAECLIK